MILFEYLSYFFMELIFQDLILGTFRMFRKGYCYLKKALTNHL